MKWVLIVAALWVDSDGQFFMAHNRVPVENVIECHAQAADPEGLRWAMNKVATDRGMTDRVVEVQIMCVREGEA